MSERKHIDDHVAFYLNKHRDQDVPWLVNRKLLIQKQFERPMRNLVVYSDLHGSYEKFLFWMKQGLGYIRIIVREILGRSYSDEIGRLYARLIMLENRSRVEMVAENIARAFDDEQEGAGDDVSSLYDPQAIFLKPIPSSFWDTLMDLEARGIRRSRVVEDLLLVLRVVTRYDEHRLFKVAPAEYHENLLTMYLEAPQLEPVRRALVNSIIESDDIYLLMTDLLARLIDLGVTDKHVNLGDTLDRGDDADRLIALYRTYFDRGAFSPFLHYIYGNHDILWLGASLGNPVQVATALRISLRYSNFGLCKRYGFDLTKLRDFALDTYKEPPTGAYVKRGNGGIEGWTDDDIVKMTKTLLIIESKLAASESRAAAGEESMFQQEFASLGDHHDRLLAVIPVGVGEDPDEQAAYRSSHGLYTDVFFPTVSADDPSRLSEGERAVIDDLVEQFKTRPRFQRDMQYLFWKGEMYRVVDGTLYFHAAFPSGLEGEFTTVGGLSGKALFDFLQREIKRIGEAHAAGDTLNSYELHLLHYLWCGPVSPLFCKSKMATLERAILDKAAASDSPLLSWHEVKNPFYANVRDESFINRVLEEFHAGTMCMGHTPVKGLNDGILSDSLTAFIVDGGASDAYGDRGAVMIKTPENSYLTLNPSLEELREADREDRLYEPVIQTLRQRHHYRLRETETGYFLQAELTAIEKLLTTRLPEYMRQYVDASSGNRELSKRAPPGPGPGPGP